MKIWFMYVSLLVLSVGLVGCGSQEAVTEAPEAAPELPANLLVESIAGTPLSVAEAREGKQAGDRVLLLGHIGGRAEPFVEGRAMFTFVDAALLQCTDACAVPWDMCCETPEDIAGSSVTVQVVDADGKLLRSSLNGPGLLAPGQTVLVAGTVGVADGSVFVVNAEQISPMK